MLHGLSRYHTPAAAAVTWDPLRTAPHNVLSGGNLIVTKSGSDAFEATVATTARSVKSYFEVYVNNAAPSPYTAVGLCNASFTNYSLGLPNTPNSFGYYGQPGASSIVYNNTAVPGTPAGFTDGDIVAIAYDGSTGSVWFAKNNTWQLSGNPSTGASPTFTGISGMTGPLFPAINIYRSSLPPNQMTGRFKASDQSYAPPTGFSPWQV